MNPEEMDAKLKVLADALIEGGDQVILSAAKIEGIGEALQHRVLNRRLDVPTIGDIIKLEIDWLFLLHRERRNESLVRVIDPSVPHGIDLNYRWEGKSKPDIPNTWTVTLPKGTELKVDRIYIRQGQSKYDSITFRIMSCPEKKYEKTRFWVKLHAANNLHYSRVFKVQD